ncbi:MAG: sulfatase-like hydrolase/transferase, partial [Bacteroidota bacterium]
MIITRQKTIDYLHLFVLTSLSLAQPLYDLLGRYADFFVSHGARPSVILKLVVVFSLIIPLVISLFEFTIDLVFRNKVRRFLHYGIIGILAGLIVIPPLNRWGILPDIAVYIMAILFGGLFSFLYIQWKFARSFLTAMSPAILIFPAYFLFFTPVSSIVFTKKAGLIENVSVGNKVPLILIIFDEFNTMALLNKEGGIDSARYPNFASLANESWWFPNAISASCETMKSIPAILTGVKPLKNHPKLGTYADYPNNLFTLLAGQYYFNVHEPETSLFPDKLIKSIRVFEPASFVSDIGMICRVLLIPGMKKNSTNFLEGRWKGFGNTVHVHVRGGSPGILFRKRQIDEFIAGIRPDTLNQVNFIHMTLPHVPYEYLSSGKSYNSSTILPDGLIDDEMVWGSSVDLADVAYQRYLQQVGYTDRVLGTILTAIKEKGIYDESLIIITADHGVSMQPNRNRRNYSEENRRDLLKVPFLLKLPDQKKAGICYDLVSGVDILPTIVEILETTLPWDHDGEPIIPGMRPGREAARDENTAIPEIRAFKPGEMDGFPLLEWKTSVFGYETPLIRLVRKDSNRALLGQDIKNLDIRMMRHPFILEIQNIDQFGKIDLGSAYLPALLRGHVTNFTSNGKLPIAIALNGRIEATTSTAQWLKEKAFFTALLPEAAFQQGRNELEVFMIQGGGDHGKQYLVKVPISGMEKVYLRSNKPGGNASLL